MIYTESEKDSLRRFMRVESPLTTYARSLRNDASQAADVEPNLLAGIDVDNLPDDLKAKLTEANNQYKTTVKTAKDTAEAKDKADKLAREHQARADRNFELLRKHNLVDSTGKPSVEGVDDPKVASLQKLQDKIAKQMNVKPEVAGQYAQMMQIALEEQEASIMQKVGNGLQSTFQTVSSLQSDRLLEGAMAQDKDGILQIDTVYKSVKENLDALISQGTTIIPDTINNLADMAYGQYIKGLKPEEREKVLNPQTVTPSFSTRRGGAVNAPVIPAHRGGNEPIAANAETAAAVAQTVALMSKGLKKGGK
jgi:hypothetical protein